MRNIFSGYDIRGQYPEEINEDLAYNVGRAFVRFLSAKVLVVGRDDRLSSEPLFEKLIEGITAEGADVIDLGLCTTPMLNFGVVNYGYDGGIMVSASHDSKEFNGFKLIKPGGIQIDGTSGLAEIATIIRKGFVSATNLGAVTKKDILADYIGHHLKAVQEIEDLKIVVDYSNGVGAISAKPFFARLDIKTIGLNEELDGNFPAHAPNPHEAKNLKDLCRTVVKEKADLGIFFDGDADRAIFVDEKGQEIPVDLLTVLLAKEELKTKLKGRVFFDLRFSKAVPGEIKALGGNPVMMAVGNPLYKKALAQGDGIIAAEFAGHIMFPENFNLDDGLFAAIKVLNILSKQKPISSLIEPLNKYETSDEISLEPKNTRDILKRIRAAFPEGKEIELDGLYLDFPDGFISVRPSRNPEPLFRFRAEAKDIKTLEERIKKVTEIFDN